MGTIDYLVVGVYAAALLTLGLLMSRVKKGHQRNAEDYFLASKSLPWWVIGASLIAANISAEQFIGMSGSGFVMGLAIASYEWMAAITLIIVAKYFLPVFIEKKLYTIPEFIEQRFSKDLKTILAIFWIALFVFVNLTTVLFLGAKAIDTIAGDGNGSLILISAIILAAFAAAYSLWGGLSAVAWTDILQVGLLIVGGTIVTVLTLNYIGDGNGVVAGMSFVSEKFPEKFQMILKPDNPGYKNLPGIAVLVGGMWVANLYYWGFNQYIIQRALAAKSLKEAQKGLAFAAYLKFILPLIVVIPGIAAFSIWNDSASANEVSYTQIEGYEKVATVRPDNTETGKYPEYVWVKNETVAQDFLKRDDDKKAMLQKRSEVVLSAEVAQNIPAEYTYIAQTDNDKSYPYLISRFLGDYPGLTGLILAALAAAIISSLASMLNSVATIFTMDIYRPYFNKNASDKATVATGRITAVVALIIACILAPMLKNIGEVFQYIQEYTGMVSPGILGVFLMGLFYKKATNKAVIYSVITSIVIALAFKLFTPNLPFMHQMSITCLATMGLIALLSYLETGGKDDPKGIALTRGLFKTDTTFNVAAYGVLIVTVVLYAIFW